MRYLPAITLIHIVCLASIQLVSAQQTQTQTPPVSPNISAAPLVQKDSSGAL